MDKKRPIIGVFFGNYHSDHSMRLISLFHQQFAKENIDIIYYLGTESSGFLGQTRMQESRYDYQYAYIFDYSRFDAPDVLIIDFGSISVCQKNLSLDTFLKKFPDTPVILIGQETPVAGTVRVYADVRDGMRMITEHLIQNHGIKRPAFVTGSLSNAATHEYLNTFLEVCRNEGVTVPPSRIVIGDYSAHLDQAIDDLLCREPSVDAIISSNDEMAIPIYRVLKKRGKIIGQDIAVTGIGNARLTRYMEPPLTTVDLNYPITVSACINQAKNILHGEKTLDISVPVKLRLRSSCGMHFRTAAAEEVSSYEYTSALTRNENGKQFGWFNALLLRELILNAGDLKTFFSKLGDYLMQSGIEASYACLLEEPQKVGRDSVFSIKDHQLLLMMMQSGKNVSAWHRSDAPVFEKNSMKSRMQTDTHRQFFTFLLFYQKYQYGIFSVCCSPEEIPDFYGLSLELGTGLHSLILLLRQDRLLEDLQKKNQVLDFVAAHDNLTGLFNRKGLLTKVLERIGQSSCTQFAALMADLDHLKQINDNFGHGNGDYAIKKAAEILSQALPEKSVLGRVGGDEFLAFFFSPTGQEPETVAKKIRSLEESFECTSDLPFYVEISVGFTLFSLEETQNMQAVIRRADEQLYKNKAGRRKSVLRPAGSI